VTTGTTHAHSQSGWLDRGGLRVFYRAQGEGQPLLLLNGLTRSVDSWGPLNAALVGRRTVAFDVPGVGNSPPSALPLSIPAIARIAVEVLDAAGVETADVLGFSHGGLVAQQFAHAAPNRVRRLVLVATSCGLGGIPSPEDFWRQMHTPSSAEPGMRLDPLTTLRHLLALSSWSSIPFLGSLRQPTLVVRGARDRLVPPENGALLARRIPGAALVTLDVGHDLQRTDRVGLLARTIEEFLPR
jgi:poly(3-hydroxyoctanoate) depolymerase